MDVVRIIREGKIYTCPRCKWRGLDYEIPDYYWHINSCVDGTRSRPVCPECENKLKIEE